MTKLTTTEQFYVRSMGKLLRVTAIFTNDADANTYMEKNNNDAVVACIGPFVLLANKNDQGSWLADR